MNYKMTMGLFASALCAATFALAGCTVENPAPVHETVVTPPDKNTTIVNPPSKTTIVNPPPVVVNPPSASPSSSP